MKFLLLSCAFLVAAQAFLTDTDTRTDTTGTLHGRGDRFSTGKTFMDTRTTGDDTYGYMTYGAKYGTTTTRTAGKEFLVRQKNILKLFNHMHTKNTDTEQHQVGQTYRIENYMDRYVNRQAVKEFLIRFKTGMLPRSKVFTISNDRHRDEAICLFHVLYYAKDFDTFYRTACWARDNMNEGTFVYAMTVTLLHRQDCRGMKMPPPYEIYPYYFFNSEVIAKAQRLKMYGNLIEGKLANYYGVDKVDSKNYVVKTNYTGFYIDTNDEDCLTYFTEDIGLNTYYFYFHATHPFWMHGETFGLTNDRRGELYLYTYQQILARYYMERLSNNMGEINRFMWTRPIKTGFTSSLIQHDGLHMPSRPNDFLVKTEDNLWDLTEVTDWERRIRDSIDCRCVITENGNTLSMDKPEDIETLGNLIQGNMDSPHTRFYIMGAMTARKLLGNAPDTFNDFMVTPAVLEQYETAMRDPMFYQLCQRIVHYYIRYKETLRPYTRDEVNFDGVRVDGVDVDRLVTFFDTVDTDITNAVYRKVDELEQNQDEMVIRARQHRLNHDPFDVRIDVTSTKTTEGMVKIFLGPKYDSMHRKINLDDNRINFFELDCFTYDLKTGKNKIVRNSRDFWRTTGDRMSTRNFMNQITKCLNGNEECMMDTVNTDTAFPDRLVLPMGKRQGMTFQLFVSVTPVLTTDRFLNKDTNKNTEKNAMTNAMTATAKKSPTGIRFVDDNALGYPLDRTIDFTEFLCSNIYLRDVTIYHKTTTTTTTTGTDTTNTFGHGEFYTHGMDTTDEMRFDTVDKTNKMDRMDGFDRVDRADRVGQFY